MRRNISLTLSMLLIGIAFWMGEGGAFLIDTLPVLIALAGCFIVTVTFPGSLLKKALIGVVSLAIIIASYFAGAYSFNCAFNECVESGENVRVQLAEYHTRNKHYPKSLKQLDGTLPGKRIIRPTIMDYKSTKDSYDLTFQDWLVEYKATQSEPFTANK